MIRSLHHLLSLMCMAMACVSTLNASKPNMPSGDRSEPLVAVFVKPGSSNFGFVSWDHPQFVAYKDGTVLSNGGWNPRVLNVVSSKASEGMIPGEVLARVAAKFSGANFWTERGMDLSTTTVWTPAGVVTIHGNWHAKGKQDDTGGTADSLNTSEEKVPSDLLSALTALRESQVSSASLWRPATVEVLFEPAGIALGEAVKWPADIPAQFIRSSATPEALLLRLDGAFFDRLSRILSRNSRPRAVEINGQRLYGRIRLVFPGENAWRAGSAGRGHGDVP